MDLEIGQVLSLRIRFNNSGDISSVKHPYLVIDIDDVIGVVEVAQIDSLEGKRYKAAFRSNKVLFCDNPPESVIDKDSYIQMDNKFTLELYNGLTQYRRQINKLSKDKLEDVLHAYRTFQENNELDENKIVYMEKDEIENLNN